MAKIIPCQGKHRESGHFAKTQGIWFVQFVNFLILNVKDISIFAAKWFPKISIFFFLIWISLPRQLYVCNSHKGRKLAWGRFLFGQGKTENTANLKMKFEWVPCIKFNSLYSFRNWCYWFIDLSGGYWSWLEFAIFFNARQPAFGPLYPATTVMSGEKRTKHLNSEWNLD